MSDPTAKPVKEVTSLEDLSAEETRAVIINCGTEWLTTLAMASLRAHATLPILVIDCNATEGSAAHFGKLAARQWRFDYTKWPLRSHGTTLDRLFREIPSKTVLLIDSDAEILASDLVPAFETLLGSDPRHYGAGFLHRERALTGTDGLGSHRGRYAERMWIPLVLLRSGAVREALAAGASFVHKRSAGGDDAGALQNLLAHRFVIQPASNDAPAGPTAFVEYDTGARLHRCLLESGYTFAALDDARWGDVAHIHGATRAVNPSLRHRLARRLGMRDETATAEAAVVERVKRQLATTYGLLLD